ncbi:MAG: arsenite methyltransferase [Candidatus Aenigmatarchaeota archaeon]
MKKDEIRKSVREGYGKIAAAGSSCCGNNNSQNIKKSIGYADGEISSAPEGAVSFGCGNPIAMASLKEGETVLDLGSGTGFDCFLAARKVGKSGKVIGVDMTPEMIKRAKENAKKGNYKNVEFRLGEIENLPAEDGSVDAIISNCVINLSPDKKKVFKEAYRVLKPGGRIMVSDIVLTKELPPGIKDSIAARVGCLAGAMKKDEYISIIKKAGFRKIETNETKLPIESMASDPFAKKIIGNMGLSMDGIKELANSAASIKVFALKA